MKLSLTALAISVVACLTMENATVAAAATLSADDRKFIISTAQAGMTEVKLGEIAKQKAKSDATRGFAETMITDHRTINAKLKAIADKKGVAVPITFDAEHRIVIDKFVSLHPTGFDRVYANQIVAHQRKILASFEIQSGKGDIDLQKFSKATLPVIKQHLRLAEELNAL
ncbi:MAG: DUF4142 domain-containing protein [Candidatus Melainabacteria bacterium]|nr:DUF4142 domain-containing protein [Candidatus Melainabacteria bacterium]